METTETVISADVWDLGNLIVPAPAGRMGFAAFAANYDSAAVVFVYRCHAGNDEWRLSVAAEACSLDDAFDVISRRSRDFEKIAAIAIDPNMYRALGARIQQELDINVVWFGQSARKFEEPLRVLMSLAFGGRIVHGGNKLLARCVVDKSLANSRLVDPIASALLMAVGEFAFAQPADG